MKLTFTSTWLSAARAYSNRGRKSPNAAIIPTCRSSPRKATFLPNNSSVLAVGNLRSRGLDLSAGTITDDLKRLAPLFEPLYQKLLDRSRTQALWNADETRWPVFQVVSAKVGHRWYVWLFESRDSVVFALDKGRTHDVPENHFGEDAIGIVVVDRVVVDRYSAYKAASQEAEQGP